MGKASRLKRTSASCKRRPGKTPLGNFGVYCTQTGALVDSAKTEEDADLLCDYLNRRLKKHPLFKPTRQRWKAWCIAYQEWTPDACTVVHQDGKGDVRPFFS